MLQTMRTTEDTDFNVFLVTPGFRVSSGFPKNTLTLMPENLSNIINFFLLEERVAGMEPEQVVVRGFVSTELHNGSMDG